jgi:hypothetical protein
MVAGTKLLRKPIAPATSISVSRPGREPPCSKTSKMIGTSRRRRAFRLYDCADEPDEALRIVRQAIEKKPRRRSPAGLLLVKMGWTGTHL